MKTLAFIFMFLFTLSGVKAQTKELVPPKKGNKVTVQVPKKQQNPAKGRPLTAEERTKIKERAIFLQAKKELEKKEGLTNPAVKEVEKEKKKQLAKRK